MTHEIFSKEPIGGRWAPLQRLVAVIGVGLFVLTSVLPPWRVPAGSDRTVRSWHWLFDPPTPATGSAEIDWLMLMFEWFVLLVATCVLVWAFRGETERSPGA